MTSAVSASPAARGRQRRLGHRVPRPAVLVLLPALIALPALAITPCSSAGTAPTATSAAPTAVTPSTTAIPTTTTGIGTSSTAAQSAVPVESNPPGDIPDTVAYVPYRNPAGRYSLVHPEGWARMESGPTVTFTDKLNGITVTAAAAAAAPEVARVRADAAQLGTGQSAFELRSVTAVHLPAGNGVLIVFRRNSAPDPVTGKVFRDEVNRYQVYSAGRQVTLDLYGPVGADNVDPYAKISQSLRLS